MPLRSFVVGEKAIPTMIKRTLQRGQQGMNVKLMCADFTASRYYLPVDSAGDVLISPEFSGNPMAQAAKAKKTEKLAGRGGEL